MSLLESTHSAKKIEIHEGRYKQTESDKATLEKTLIWSGTLARATGTFDHSAYVDIPLEDNCIFPELRLSSKKTSGGSQAQDNKTNKFDVEKISKNDTLNRKKAKDLKVDISPKRKVSDENDYHSPHKEDSPIKSVRKTSVDEYNLPNKESEKDFERN